MTDESGKLLPNDMGAERLYSPYTGNETPEELQKLENDDRSISAWHPWRSLDSLGRDSFQIENLEEFGREIEAGERFYLAVTVPVNGTFPKAEPQSILRWYDLLEVKFEGWEMHLTDRAGNTEKRTGSILTRRRTTYHALPDGSIGAVAGGDIIILEDDEEFGGYWQAVKARNERLGIETPEGLTPFFVEDGAPPEQQGTHYIEVTGARGGGRASCEDHHEKAPDSASGGDLMLFPPAEGGAKPKRPKRPGQSLIVTPKSFRVPTPQELHTPLAMINAGRGFLEISSPARIDVRSRDSKGNEVAFFLDPETNLQGDAIIQKLFKHGPSVVQTFFAMWALREQKCKGKPYNVPVEANISDLLKIMGRTERKGSGYTDEEITPRAQDVVLLSLVWVPAVHVTEVVTGKAAKGNSNARRSVKRSILKLVNIDRIDQYDVFGDGAARNRNISFRFHFPEEIHDWFTGSQWQAMSVKHRLLQYHPQREKMKFSLGMTLIYFHRINLNKKGAMKIKLSSLLDAAHVEYEERCQERLDAAKDAIEALSRDGIIPGLRFVLPSSPEKRKARELLMTAEVHYDPNALLQQSRQLALMD